MHFITNLIVLAAIAASTFVNTLNVTTPTQDYFLLSQRKLQNDIYISEMKINCVDELGAGNMKLLADQQQVLLKENDKFQQSLVPLQALSPIHKFCIQEYKPELVSYDAVKKALAACLSTAQTRVNSLTTTPKSNLNYAKTAANTNLPKAVATCNNSYATTRNETKLQECVLSAVETNAKSVESYLNAVDKTLETSKSNLNDLCRDEIRCSFLTERESLVTIGSVSDSIDNCLSDEGRENRTSIQTGPSIKSEFLRGDID